MTNNSKCPAIMFGLLMAIPAALVAQTTSADSARINRISPVVTTATRTATPLLDVPAPVLRVDSSVIRLKMPNSAGDLLRELPGVDVTGVGTNQSRPVIRGQRGQRI